MENHCGRAENWDWRTAHFCLPQNETQCIATYSNLESTSPGAVGQPCNSPTWEAKASGSRVGGHLGLCSGFKASLG